jgi:hypothetical protein
MRLNLAERKRLFNRDGKFAARDVVGELVEARGVGLRLERFDFDVVAVRIGRSP